MDPFTERMLARAKARREKQDSQNPNGKADTGNGLDETRLRNPLQDHKQMQLLKVTTEVEVTLTKSGKDHVSNATVNVTPTKPEPTEVTYDESEEDTLKENMRMASSNSRSQNSSASIRETARSRLQRLGALYADSQLSSPIHQTEGSFSAEQDEEQQPSERSRSRPRLARFAVLADTIKNWEDDLSHPSAATCHEESPDKQESCYSETNSFITKKDIAADDGRAGSEPYQVHQGKKFFQDKSKAKQVSWDQKIIAALEAQGFTRTQSKSRLVYDYSKRSSQDDGKDATRDLACSKKPSSNKLERILETVNSSQEETASSESSKDSGLGSIRSNSSCNLNSSPEKRGLLNSPRTAGVPQMGIRVGSPQRDASPRSGSVLHKASLFESNSPTKKNGKDPAELSVSERLALFERNKGQALIPKAPFSMPIPAKYLDKDGDKNALNKSPPGKANKSVGSFVSQFQKGTGDTPRNEVSVRTSPGKIVGKAVEEKINQMNKNRTVEDNLASSNTDVPVSSSKALAQMFERGSVITADKSIVKNAQTERQKEMEMLLNRWNKNKQMASSDESNLNKQTVEKVNPPIIHKPDSMGPPPRPPPLPTAADLSPKKMSQSASISFYSAPSHPSDVSSAKSLPTPNQSSPSVVSPEKRHEALKPSEQYPGLSEVKKIKVSPPKPGRLYPCLSDIEATETESEMQDEFDQSISDDMDSSGGNMDSSFGRSIFQAAGIDGSSSINKQDQRKPQEFSSGDESDMESAVLEEIDDFLDEALGHDSDSDSSPSPPKRTKDVNHSPQKNYLSQGKKLFSSPTSSQSHSFKYSRGPTTSDLEDTSTMTPKHRELVPPYVVDGNEEVPLMHTVSFYRRQQNLAVKGTPVRQVVRHVDPQPVKIPCNPGSKPDEGSVSAKIAELVDEVSKQQTVISQASQALNLCCSTIEFSGSAEEVEGERLLLLATHRRQAALHEIQRLKVEGSLKSGGYSSELTEKGSLTVSNITLPLKKEYLRALAGAEQCHHFVCLVRTQEQVVATPALAASSENLRQGGGSSLIFPGSLKLDGLYSDFKATLEIYTLQTQKEILPHDVKYHISGKKDGNGNKHRLTPKKLLKQDSRLVMPTVQSPAGPSAVRSPAFQMSGYVVFSLREVRRTQFTLNKVAYSSPLDGNIQLKLSSELQLDIGEKGFLTMFEDVSGFGAWHRRWCLLEGAILSYWKYPDDEKKKVPIGQLDLNECTTETVGLVSRDICARPHTFLLETTRPSRPNDEDSLVLVRCGNETIIRHLLSADTREDRLAWCAKLNKALAMLRVWGSKSSTH